MQPFRVENHSINKQYDKMKPMKILFTLLLASAPLFSSAQCCPYVNGIEIIPAIPTSSDNVKIVTTVTTPNQGMFLYSSHTITGNTINIEACYYSGLLTALQTYLDTIEIGTLSPGVIDINFVAYQSTDTSSCTYQDSMGMIDNFTVLDNTNSLPSIQQEIGKLYPNPNNGTFSIELPAHISATAIRIIDLSGTTVRTYPFIEKIETDLATGFYLIQFLENDVLIGNQRMIVR